MVSKPCKYFLEISLIHLHVPLSLPSFAKMLLDCLYHEIKQFPLVFVHYNLKTVFVFKIKLTHVCVFLVFGNIPV